MFEKEIISLLKKHTKLKDISLETPPDPSFGDFSFPCFPLSKSLKKSPVEIAKDLQKKLKPAKNVEKITAKGPYLNFFIKKQNFIRSTISTILKQKHSYGSTNLGRNKKLLIEHTSINPNAAPHVGRARNALIGDSLARIFKFQKYKVRIHFFVNDIGKQVAMLVFACGSKKPSFDELLSYYVDINKKIEKNPELEKEVFSLLNRLEKSDKEAVKKFRRVVEICVKGQSNLFSRLGIYYDSFDFESDFIWSKGTRNILDELKKSESFFKDSEGRFVLNQEEFRTEMRSPYFVLTRSDETSLYPLRDLAYTLFKLKIAPNNLIVLGEDQKLYYKQLSAALCLLGYSPPKVIHYSFVLLPEGKMSTRKGNLVLLSDLMDLLLEKSRDEFKKRNIKHDKNLVEAIAFSALKYGTLKVSPDKNVLFDLDKALSFEGDTGPYIQYVHARASSILRKKKFLGNPDYKLLVRQEELNLVKSLSLFPSIVLKSSSELKPHLIANYAYGLAQTFNEFYHTCQCISDDPELTKARLSLVFSTKIVISNALSLLGISSPERM